MKMMNMMKGKAEAEFSDDSTFILSILGISTTIGRVLIGWVADRPWSNTYFINNGSMVLAGLVTVVCPFLDGNAQMTIFAVGFGFFTGEKLLMMKQLKVFAWPLKNQTLFISLLFSAGFLSLRSIVLVDLIGLDRLTSSFGLLLLFQGIASIAGSPIAGKPP